MENIFLEITSGNLKGKNVIESKKRLKDLTGVFADEQVRSEMDQEQIIYRVQAYMPVDEGTPGGLFFGNSIILPGKVGKEYFMTRGHFHSRRETSEFYWCIKGEGALIMMDEEGNSWFEKMIPGRLMYIPGNVAHRVANTGNEELVFNACWPSDAGHDYDAISSKGFGFRLMEVNGEPLLVKE